jgi:hypothetical protein
LGEIDSEEPPVSEAGEEEQGAPDYIGAFLALSRRAKIRVLIPVSFVLWHVAVVLLWGAGERVREVVRPVVGFYAGGLKLAGTWGMFSSPSRMHVTFVYGVKEDGQRIMISPDPESTLYQSLVDMRERKMRTRLDDEGQRNAWGNRYLDSFCQRPDGSWFQRVELESAEHDEQRRWGTRKVVLSRPCFFAHKKAQEAKQKEQSP